MTDNINHPAYYKSGDMEVIDVISDKEPNCHAMTINEMPNFTHRKFSMPKYKCPKHGVQEGAVCFNPDGISYCIKCYSELVSKNCEVVEMVYD